MIVIILLLIVCFAALIVLTIKKNKNEKFIWVNTSLKSQEELDDEIEEDEYQEYLDRRKKHKPS